MSPPVAVRWYADRTNLVEFLHALTETGEIQSSTDAAYAIEKATRWTNGEFERLRARWLATLGDDAA